jgi:hypothetical protein
MRATPLFVLAQAMLAAARVPALSERQQSNSFAGVNSFFLHAFQEYVYMYRISQLALTPT